MQTIGNVYNINSKDLMILSGNEVEIDFELVKEKAIYINKTRIQHIKIESTEKTRYGIVGNNYVISINDNFDDATYYEISAPDYMFLKEVTSNIFKVVNTKGESVILALYKKYCK